MSLRPLTAELDDKNSPVRRFLDERFTAGLREVQRATGRLPIQVELRGLDGRIGPDWLPARGRAAREVRVGRVAHA